MYMINILKRASKCQCIHALRHSNFASFYCIKIYHNKNFPFFPRNILPLCVKLNGAFARQCKTALISDSRISLLARPKNSFARITHNAATFPSGLRGFQRFGTLQLPTPVTILSMISKSVGER